VLQYVLDSLSSTSLNAEANHRRTASSSIGTVSFFPASVSLRVSQRDCFSGIKMRYDGLFSFLTRLIVVPFIIEMVVAMLSTKIALYLETSPLPPPPDRIVGGVTRDPLGLRTDRYDHLLADRRPRTVID
jgi:hypothetical protein